MIWDPPGGSKSPQDGLKHGQDGLRSTQECSKTVLKIVFVAVQNLLRFSVVWGSFWDRFWLPLASPNASLWAPFWRSKSTKKSIRNPTALKVVLRAPQERPRLSQDAPGPLRTPLGLPKTPPGPLPETHRCPAGPSLTTRKHFPKHLAQLPFSEKSKKSNLSKYRQKNTMLIHGGRSTQSLTKTECTFMTVEPQWQRWSREELFNMIPLIFCTCSDSHRTALQPKLFDP